MVRQPTGGVRRGVPALRHRLTVTRPTGLWELASPFLHDLYGATLTTLHLAVRDGEQVLYLDRLAGHASVPAVSTIGSRLPMHATGVGKVLLAYTARPVVRRSMASGRAPSCRVLYPHHVGLLSSPG
jgi:DNA-binding IclR family transcriptional regulator